MLDRTADVAVDRVKLRGTEGQTGIFQQRKTPRSPRCASASFAIAINRLPLPTSYLAGSTREHSHPLLQSGIYVSKVSEEAAELNQASRNKGGR